MLPLVLRLLGPLLALMMALPCVASAAPPKPTAFNDPELGVNFHLAPAGLFGIIGGSLVIAPVPFLVLEPGIAQRLDEEPRFVGLVRARLVRARRVAFSLGLGFDHERNYEAFSLCGLGDEYKCGNYARNVWGMPLQASIEVRMPAGLTIQPYVGFTIPVHWDRCDTYRGGDVTGSCIPLLRPYLGVSFGWSSPISSMFGAGGKS